MEENITGKSDILRFKDKFSTELKLTRERYLTSVLIHANTLYVSLFLLAAILMKFGLFVLFFFLSEVGEILQKRVINRADSDQQ